MDILRRWSLNSKFQIFYERVSRFSIRRALPSANPEKIKLIRGFVLVLMAILFAWTSLQATQENSFVFFRNTEWPHVKLWKLSLNGLGYHAEPQVADYSLALQSHPAPYSEETALCISEDRCLIYLTHSPFQSEQTPELWVCSGGKPKAQTHWNKIGAGLNGIHRLMTTLENVPQNRENPSSIARNRVDPKEIRY